MRSQDIFFALAKSLAINLFVAAQPASRATLDVIPNQKAFDFLSVPANTSIAAQKRSAELALNMPPISSMNLVEPEEFKPAALKDRENQFEIVIETEYSKTVLFRRKRIIVTRYGKEMDVATNFVCPEIMDDSMWAPVPLIGGDLRDLEIEIHPGNWCWAKDQSFNKHGCIECWTDMWIRYHGVQIDVTEWDHCTRWDARTDTMEKNEEGDGQRANVTCTWYI